MGTEEENLKCSVTVMLMCDERIGFLRRDKDDSFGGLLTAPGGGLIASNGDLMDGVMYYSVESAAIREVWEKTGIRITRDSLRFFCSLTLPGGAVVISLYCDVSQTQVARSYGYLEFYNWVQIMSRDDFAPGMKQESLLLLEYLKK